MACSLLSNTALARCAAEPSRSLLLMKGSCSAPNNPVTLYRCSIFGQVLCCSENSDVLLGSAPSEVSDRVQEQVDKKKHRKADREGVDFLS
eukprot:1998122-Rhodomonas_salina.1